MLRDLLKDGGLYTLANFLTKGIGLLLIPFYTAYFTPSDYGVIDLLTIFGLFLSSILTLQLSQAAARYISEKSISEADKKKISSTALWVLLFVSLLGAGTIYLLANPILNLLDSDVPISNKTFLISLVYVCLSNVYHFNNVHLRFLRYSKSFALISLAYGLLTVCLTIFFVLKLDLGIDGYFYGATAPYLIILVIQFIILRKEIILTVSKKFLKKLFRFSLPLVPGAMAYVILNFTDRIFINDYLGTDEVGIYGIASKFSTIVHIVVLSISAALGPIVFERHLSASSKQELQRVLNLFFIAGAGFVLSLSLFSFETLYIFTNEQYYSAITVMPILFISVYFSGFSMFSIGLQIQEKTKIIGLFVLISASLNIFLNYVLIPSFNLYGAAFSTLISTAFNTVSLFFISQKYYKLNFELKKYAGVLLLLLCFVSLGVYFEQHTTIPYAYILGLKIILILLYVLFLLRLKLIKLKGTALGI